MILQSLIAMIVNFVLQHNPVVFAAYKSETETEVRNQVIHKSLYDPLSRPEEQTHIKVGLHLFAIDSLNLQDQTLTLAGWLTFEWQDKRLCWNHLKKDGLKYIFVKSEQVWKPELLVDNSLQDLDIIESEAILLRLRYDGTIDWELPLLFVTHCEVDITFYPYDTQRCAVELLSWSYTIDEVILDHLYEEINLEDFQEHGEWHILHTSVEDRNLTEHLPDGTLRIYPQLNFWITLQRRAGFYNLNVIMPIVVTSFMVVMVFLVPLDSGEKISYILTEFLALLVLLTVVVPPTSITVSILALYLSFVLVLAAFGILMTVMVMFMYHKEGSPCKGSMIIGITTCMARVTCLNIDKAKARCKREHDEQFNVKPFKYENENLSNGLRRNSKDDNKDITEFVNSMSNEIETTHITWRVVAAVFDRFYFFLCLLTTVIMNISFILALSIGGTYAQTWKTIGHH